MFRLMSRSFDDSFDHTFHVRRPRSLYEHDVVGLQHRFELLDECFNDRKTGNMLGIKAGLGGSRHDCCGEAAARQNEVYSGFGCSNANVFMSFRCDVAECQHVSCDQNPASVCRPLSQ